MTAAGHGTVAAVPKPETAAVNDTDCREGKERG